MCLLPSPITHGGRGGTLTVRALNIELIFNIHKLLWDFYINTIIYSFNENIHKIKLIHTYRVMFFFKYLYCRSEDLENVSIRTPNNKFINAKLPPKSLSTFVAKFDVHSGLKKEI